MILRQSALRIAVASLTLTALLCGCAGDKSKSPADQSRSATRPATAGAPFTGDVTTSDPCGNRLHDLCGSLLLYYAIHQRLPQRAEELAQVGGPADAASLACPVSNQAYVYNPKGLLAPDTRSLVILYDPSPSHDGRRRAISIVEPQRDNDALVAKVVTLPDVFFQRPAATPQAP
jgi:hypothetical protein